MEEIQPYQNKIKYLQILLISLGILGFQLISSIPEVIGVNSRIVSVPYRALYFLLGILALITIRWTFKINKYFLPIIIFIFLYFLRYIYDSISRYDELKDGLLEFWLFAFIMGFFAMTPFLFKINANTLDKAKISLFVIAIIVNVLGFKNNFGAFSEEKVGARFVGNEVLNQITYGQTGVVLIILCLSYFYSFRKLGKICLVPLIGLGLINVALAGSRGPMIELALAVMCFITINFRQIGILNLTIATVFFIGLGVYFSDYLIFFYTILDRLQDTGFNQGSGSEERYFLFTDAWSQFLANPIFGYEGIGAYPHNLILESFMALGIFGGFLMIYIIIIAIRNCIGLIKVEPTNWFALIFLMHIVGTFISGSIWNSFEFWSLLALSFSLYYNRNLYIKPITR